MQEIGARIAERPTAPNIIQPIVYQTLHAGLRIIGASALQPNAF